MTNSAPNTITRNTLLTTPTVGLEEIQRAAFFVFYEGFNPALVDVAAYWNPRDVLFDQHTNRKTAPTTLEPISNKNFHEGHKPSLVKGTVDDYPNLAVFATRADPSPESDQFDQMDSWSDAVLIEIMVKATDEDAVNRRIQRAAEAAVICVRQNPTLGGAVTGLEGVPNVVIGDVFAVRETPNQGGYGQRFIWQGAAINFRIRNDSVTPGLPGSIFSQSSQVDYSQFIDQG